MTASTAGRDGIVAALRAELLGPAPAGKALDVSTTVRFKDKKAAYETYIDAATGEEILDREPTVRYGIGVLFPAALDRAAEAKLAIVPGLGEAEEGGDSAQIGHWEDKESDKRTANKTHADDSDYDLSGANELKPSAMGVSLLIKTDPTAILTVRLEGGRYRQVSVELPGGSSRTWWVRVPVKAVWRFEVTKITSAIGPLKELTPDEATGIEGLDPRLTVNPRQHPDGLLTTFAVVNRSDGGKGTVSARCLFQAKLRATVSDGRLLPYPENPGTGGHPDDDSFRLIYRDAEIFAVGHGCAADWARPDETGRILWAEGDPLPGYETPSITPDILLPDGSPLKVSMAQLAGVKPGGMTQLERVVDEYARWIASRRVQGSGLGAHWHETVERHLELCEEALSRMRDGLDLVRDENSVIGKAFRLANQAMRRQQLRSDARTRPLSFENDRITVDGAPPDEAASERKGRGTWRAFQIAFLLAAIPSTADGSHPDRETVDLIFFPTGGGKTEAYLGLAAFTMLLRRLRDQEDIGVTILMRYTLRLLTAQQLLRAATLICALEDLRPDHQELGSEPFSIGIWVGSDSTPNTRAEARKSLGSLGRSGQDNPFLLLRCPWCATQMGPIRVEAVNKVKGRSRPSRGRGQSDTFEIAGYELRGSTVTFLCPDPSCRFSDERCPLPIYIIDEDVYDQRPSIVIGTVDKFAMLAWRPEARALFGINASGSRELSPPSLIIQDELHLISGPLGSMTGLYEAVIDELCTDKRGTIPIPAKIVASTATIRRHEEQVRALYGREKVRLFPPHGIDAEDSFFAVYARDRETHELLPGRKYIGLHAPALGSMQTTQVRSFAALLQAAKDADEEDCDPWWTLMAFFNSLRELGNSLSLLQSDIPDYLKTIKNRANIQDWADVRNLWRVKEMTSRLRQDEVPKSMEDLSQVASSGKAIDVCLASSLIEVGIDIDRLSLMTVVGQPKSTSQYIQVTGRVGRRWWERPGLVVTLYGAAKPRDRSHFEHFRSYHQRLYAQVEPTSVTPFAPPVLERALHAAMVTYIRQCGPEDLTPYPLPESLFEAAAEVMRKRSRFCDPAESDRLEGLIERLRQEWLHWEPTSWGSPSSEPKPGDLMRTAGQFADPQVAQMTWPSPTSMRGVDAECRAEISSRYALDGARA